MLHITTIVVMASAIAIAIYMAGVPYDEYYQFLAAILALLDCVPRRGGLLAMKIRNAKEKPHQIQGNQKVRNVGKNYFDQKIEKDEDGVITKMAYCKWCPAVFKKTDSIDMVDNIAFNDKALEYLKFLISECPTRWNSTHDMLKTAIELKDAFFYYDFNNSCFARDLEETPKRADFEKCRKVVQFLEKFKGTTELVSNVSSPVAHLWFGEVLDIDKHLREWQANAHFKDMIVDMRKKYDKYWGDYKKINHYMYFAVILDPTMKSEIIGYGFKHLIENGCMPMEQDEEDSQETPFQFLTPDELCAKFVEKVEKAMGLLFAIYKEKNMAHAHQATYAFNVKSINSDWIKVGSVGKQPELENHVGVGGYGYPAFIPLNIKNGAYALLKRDTFTDGSVKCTMTSMTASEPVVSLAVSPFSKDSGNKCGYCLRKSFGIRNMTWISTAAKMF
ncbi:zinc finger BED domain-containing protein RICESLEEPER 2 [Tanacetum coccineum]